MGQGGKCCDRRRKILWDLVFFPMRIDPAEKTTRVLHKSQSSSSQLFPPSRVLSETQIKPWWKRWGTPK
jgi:hypothetical protein